jgi:hypothetical protein
MAFLRCPTHGPHAFGPRWVCVQCGSKLVLTPGEPVRTEEGEVMSAFNAIYSIVIFAAFTVCCVLNWWGGVAFYGVLLVLSAIGEWRDGKRVK